MREILPGVSHWTTTHERWGIEISSYLLADERVVIDPRVPGEGLEWFEGAGAPVAALLTNRHHYRHAGRFHERFGCRVLGHRQGLHEFSAGEPVEGFDPGDELPGGVLALEVGGLCPDEAALLSPAHRTLALGDGLVRNTPDGALEFVPDRMMDDPPATKRALAEAYRRLLDRPFDHLLLAHGGPLVGDGRAALARAVGG
jgi:hypothetical protein